jgi:restriction system protein
VGILDWVLGSSRASRSRRDTDSNPPLSIPEQAAEWFARLQADDVTAKERRQYIAWLRQSPVHIAESMRVERISRGLTQRPLRLERITSALDEQFRALEEHSREALVQAAIVTPVEDVPDGVLIEAVTIPWLQLVALLERDPDLVYQLHWRKWEEIVAATYERQGFKVVLTKPSNDGGRDVIAVHRDIGQIRIFDQVKAYSPGHLVTANDVRAMLGVLTADRNVSKGFVTTTSTFAPGIYRDSGLTSLMPYRLELRPRDALIAWLAAVKNNEPQILGPDGRPFTASRPTLEAPR